ncbi:MAG: SDR family oxidoreductase [Pseudomonadota bacterium]
MNDFAGKTALVTGASSGIGAATAVLLAERGARVLTVQRRPAGFEDIEADLTDPAAPKAVMKQVSASIDRLDCLVNAAGIMAEGTVEETSEEAWAAQIHVNLTVPFLMTKYAMPLLKAAKGAIVNIGSVEGLANNPGHPAYGASKAGLHGLTRAVAVDEGPDGVRCNAVAPGWIDTPLNEDFIASMPDPDAFRSGLSGIHPMGRTGTPKDVAQLIAWLLSDEAAWITGQVWTIDGGRMTQLSLP